MTAGSSTCGLLSPYDYINILSEDLMRKFFDIIFWLTFNADKLEHLKYHLPARLSARVGDTWKCKKSFPA